MSRIVFMDTETTGLSLEDDIWEFACIIRDPRQADVEWQTFVKHDLTKAEGLPASFLADYRARYDPLTAIFRDDLAHKVQEVTAGRAHIVGAVPNFDTERLALLMGEELLVPGWHYHLIDVENLAVGFLAGRAVEGNLTAGLALPDLPWDSDALSAAVGVSVPQGSRHTALGDARWARDIYDAVMGPR